MATWEREEHGEWTCPKCGNVYAISCMRFPSRDRISIFCDCGEVIFSGNTTHDYSKSFLREGNPTNARVNPSLG